MSGLDRQVYYRSLKRSKVRTSKAQQVVALVEEKRIMQPKIGGKKLYFMLKEPLKSLNIGRDKFFDILRANHLLIVPNRSYHVTTNSHHRFRKHKNMILDYQITKPNQVWVADITYIGNRKNPSYLSLITDAYSKKIVGHNVAENLNTESSLIALKKALRNKKVNLESLIHHSDRGLQYCSNEYQRILEKHHLKCSMTQNSDPYENAVAERINGILKQEFDIDKYDIETPLRRKIVDESIEIYNELRPHFSNHYLTPNQMHNLSELKMKTYKTKNRSKNVFASI
ncbi:IS3 family transposase [Chryseobacterium sp. CFBP8996]|uniref:IS3 family transposase n=1 Tax=Chryseobacterium sp. CFBP8996 TaxID=3096529 RepID=UPI002A6AB64A|nr:IS3 family transposase [Chryseobacterium sp. CFBP8996]MDY0932814.1 IS3 family transposase [Chryseobacterium sp. CFBP8996]